jgi:hypothetical protein
LRHSVASDRMPPADLRSMPHVGRLPVLRGSRVQDAARGVASGGAGRKLTGARRPEPLPHVGGRRRSAAGRESSGVRLDAGGRAARGDHRVARAHGGPGARRHPPRARCARGVPGPLPRVAHDGHGGRPDLPQSRPGAGTSPAHPHSQIVATPVVPIQVVFFQDHNWNEEISGQGPIPKTAFLTRVRNSSLPSDAQHFGPLQDVPEGAAVAGGATSACAARYAQGGSNSRNCDDKSRG